MQIPSFRQKLHWHLPMLSACLFPSSLLAALLLCNAGFSYAAPVSGNGANCNPAQLPDNPVLVPTSTANLYLYPNAGEVNSQYTGCQNIWLQDGHLLSQAEYKNGVIQRYRGWEPDDSASYECLYKDAQLVKANPDPSQCPAVDDFPFNKQGKYKHLDEVQPNNANSI